MFISVTHVRKDKRFNVIIIDIIYDRLNIDYKLSKNAIFDLKNAHPS